MLSKTSSAVYCRAPLSQSNSTFNSGDLFNEQVYTRTEAVLRSITNHQLPPNVNDELESIKHSIEDIKRDLQDLENYKSQQSSQRVNTQPPQSQVSSFRASARRTRQTRQNLKIASMSHLMAAPKRAASSGKPAIGPVLYIPLSKLLSAKYVRQVSANQLQVFALDKSCSLGAARVHTYASPIQTDPNALVASMFRDLNPQHTFHFHCMKGTHKGLILQRILAILGDTIKASANVRFNLAEVVYMDKPTQLEGLLSSMWRNISEGRQCQHLRIDELEIELQDSKQRYRSLKKLISDQVQLNQNRSRQMWSLARQSLRKNFVFQMQIDDDENSNIAFVFLMGKPNQSINLKLSLTDPEDYSYYLHLLKQTTNPTRMFCLNPQLKNHRAFNEYLSMML